VSEQGDTIVEEDTVVDEAPHLKRWTFALVLVPVWIVAAIVGLALYLWWYHSIDKTPALFVVLVYLVACTVAAVLTAMVQNKPLVSALAIALVSAPFASTAAASVLYGIYFCDRASRCLLGLVPY
jgi:FtsH-binding integral membrane protein